MLYERLQVMAGHFEEMRRNLERTVEAYNKTVGSLESRVLVSARRFGELGVATDGDLPELATIDRAPRGLHALPIRAEEPRVHDDAPPAFLTSSNGTA
jgi:DNA recombination protein RmuC